MILSMPSIPAITIPTHIANLSNAEINALLDTRLFGRERWCTGDLIQASGGAVCAICGAVEEPCASVVFLARRGHPRLVPQYSIEDILGVMHTKDQVAQDIFASTLRFTITGPQHDAVRGTSRELLLVLYGLSPRVVGEAALKACGVVTPQGIVK